MIADVATAIPMDARGLEDSAAASVRRVGSGRENIAKSNEEVHDSRVEVSIQWMKEAFCPSVRISHVIAELQKLKCTFPYSPNTFLFP